MPRQKISEFRAKTILSQALQLPYEGWSIDDSVTQNDQFERIDNIKTNFVVKVDEAIKGRFKKGLVALDIKQDDIPQSVESLRSKGFSHFIIEPMIGHDQTQERYMSITSDREGLTLSYTEQGGVDVEQNTDSIQRVKLDDETNWGNLAHATGLTPEYLQNLVTAYKQNYFVFLEINPYVVDGTNVKLLDAAVEVDDAAEFFVTNWQASDFRSHRDLSITVQELVSQDLDANSPASFKLSVLNPNGSIFLLLSGGGASIVVADEIYNQGYGAQLANYGEYSGNPNTEETYIYTKAVLELVLASSARPKVLFVGGAVANFTDIAKTFAGVIQAINEVADQLSEHQTKIFVRRGGPNQETGLAKLRQALAKHNLLGAVHDPQTPLTVAVTEALQAVGHE